MLLGKVRVLAKAAPAVVEVKREQAARLQAQAERLEAQIADLE